MRNVYERVAQAARRFFAVTGLPVPGFARRVHRVATSATARGTSSDIDREAEAQRRAIERLEVMAYIDRLGHRDD
jgi:hypothetical protein